MKLERSRKLVENKEEGHDGQAAETKRNSFLCASDTHPR